jgi:2-polyprenyl-3-methyl-5-hydroxy-6-metoxy-1,4-benzoquinol methylase
MSDFAGVNTNAPPTYFENSRAEMIEYVPVNASLILDVGCGNGHFGKALKEARPNVTVFGIEPEKEASEEAAKYLFKSINGFFIRTDIPVDLKFDCIVFNDVLEHMPDPWGALKLANSILNPGGVVVASIPNILYFPSFGKFFFSKNWKYESSGTFDKTHLRFFTKKSIIELFNETGYDLIKIEGLRPYRSKKFWLWNLLTFGRFNEMKFLQFACSAKPKKL